MKQRMRKITSFLLCVMLIATVAPMVSSGYYYHPSMRFEEPVGDIYMPKVTPSIDGIISDNEWKNSVYIDETNYVNTYNYNFDSYPKMNTSFSWDDNALYIAADITDDTFNYSTGYDTLDLGAYGYPSDENIYGYNGDVFILALDPLRDFYNNGFLLFSENNAWLCFSLFENNTVRVYRSRFMTGDITHEVTAAGTKTENGWRFEAKITWDTIADCVDAASFGILSLDKDKIKTPGSVSNAEIIYMDREYSREWGEVATANRFMTTAEFSVKGVRCTDSPNTSIGLYGINLITADENGKAAGYPTEIIPNTLDEKCSFNDLNINAWYYTPIKEAVISNLFAGESKNTFSPDTPLTRAMFVTALGSLAKTDYVAEKPVFSDVPLNTWYSNNVGWAVDIGITAGTGGNSFSPSLSITREQMITILYKYTQHCKYRVDGIDNNILDSYADTDAISPYAQDAVKWAVSSGIIRGIESEGKMYIMPKGTATRAQSATMLNAYNSISFNRFAKDGEYTPITICGNDISEYVIVYGDKDFHLKAAQALQKYIKLTSDTDINIYRDNSYPPTDKEIVIGSTTRETDDIITIDRSEINAEGFIIKTDGDRLIIAGGVGETKDTKGTLNGVYDFISNYLGWVFATKDSEERYYNDKSIDIPSDTYKVKNPQIESLTWLEETDSVWNQKIKLPGRIMRTDDGYQASMAYLIDGKYANDNWKAINYCYSDPEIIEAAKKGLLRHIMDHPNQDMYNVTQNDNNYYCLCDRCQQIYREEGSTAGTLVRLQNECAEIVKEKFPDKKIMIIAYDFTARAPKSELCDNIILRAITINMCFHHPLNDDNCPLNSFLFNEYKKWAEKAKVFYVGDHITTFYYYLTPVANIDSIYENFRFYNSLDYKGLILWGTQSSTDGTMLDLQRYLITQMFWEKGISRDEYYLHVEAFLEAYVGDGWKSIYKYNDLLNEIQGYVHFGNNSSVAATLPDTLFSNSVDRLESYWNEAMSAVDVDSLEYAHLERAKTSFTFIKQTFTHDERYTNGDEESKAAYAEENKALADTIKKYMVAWNERGYDIPYVDYTISPEKWS